MDFLDGAEVALPLVERDHGFHVEGRDPTTTARRLGHLVPRSLGAHHPDVCVGRPVVLSVSVSVVVAESVVAVCAVAVAVVHGAVARSSLGSSVVVVLAAVGWVRMGQGGECCIGQRRRRRQGRQQGRR